jgi:hypothetical protein
MNKLRIIEWSGENEGRLDRVYHTHRWTRYGETLLCDTCVMTITVNEGIDQLNGHLDDWGDDVFHLLPEDE